MRVLVVFHYWSSPEVQYETFRRLAEHGHEVIAIHAGVYSSFSVDKPYERVTVYSLPYVDFSFKGKITPKYPLFIGLNRLLRSLEYDVMIIASHLFLTAVQALRIALKMDKPTILGVHGVYAHRGPVLNSIQRIYLRTVARWIFKKVDIIRCLTLEDAQEVMRYGAPSGKIRIIPNPINTDLFKPRIKRVENTLIWTGRMVPEKGLRYLIEAMNILVHKYGHRDVHLLLIGAGPQQSLLFRMVKKYQLNNNVNFLGWLPRRKVAEYLSKATLFVFPSLREGMPFSLLEALSSGLPAVGSNVPGVRSLIIHKHNGLLVPPKDPTSLARAIAYLLKHRDLRLEMSKNARKYVMANFSYQRVLPLMEQLYTEAIESHYGHSRRRS